jgi:uncharacterized membrane protein YtjA (UPF0391 family)
MSSEKWRKKTDEPLYGRADSAGTRFAKEPAWTAYSRASTDEAWCLMEVSMIGWALTFLVIGLIAAVLGFTTVAGASFAIAKFLAVLFLILFLVFLVLGRTAARNIV